MEKIQIQRWPLIQFVLLLKILRQQRLYYNWQHCIYASNEALGQAGELHARRENDVTKLINQLLWMGT